MSGVIVHLSDLHFGDTAAVLNHREVGLVLQGLLTKAGSEATLVLSGDITFKGNERGYSEAKEAMQQALMDSKCPPDRIIVCPGNHDIVTKSTGSFATFDAWSTSMRNDKRCTFSKKSCQLVPCGSIDFLVLNSAYHIETGYGLVELDEVRKVLKEIGPRPARGRFRVAVMHHHLVPVVESDLSTTRNAYGVLSLLAENSFSLVLHGHQHALLNLHVGENSMKICGVGSFRFSNPGFINSATIHRLKPEENMATEYYAISKDANDFHLMPTNMSF